MFRVCTVFFGNFSGQSVLCWTIFPCGFLQNYEKNYESNEIVFKFDQIKTILIWFIKFLQVSKKTPHKVHFNHFQSIPSKIEFSRRWHKVERSPNTKLLPSSRSLCIQTLNSPLSRTSNGEIAGRRIKSRKKSKNVFPST